MNKIKMDGIMLGLPYSYRYMWCTSSICGCMGCANRAGGAESKGVTKEDWKQWVKENPKYEQN